MSAKCEFENWSYFCLDSYLYNVFLMRLRCVPISCIRLCLYLLVEIIHVDAIFELYFELDVIPQSNRLTTSQLIVCQTAEVGSQLIGHVPSWRPFVTARRVNV